MFQIGSFLATFLSKPRTKVAAGWGSLEGGCCAVFAVIWKGCYKLFELCSQYGYPVDSHCFRRSSLPCSAIFFLFYKVMRTPPVREESQELPEDSSQWVGLGRSVPVPAPYFSRFSWLGPLGSFFLMMLALPFIVGLVILTKLTSRGPGIYRQTRVGFGGDVFTVYKIRTMSNDAEASSGPVWTSGISDPRVTALGKFMRASHLDELPQLFNVLKGEMSLIGPRPERPEFTQFSCKGDTRLCWAVECEAWDYRVSTNHSAPGQRFGKRA